MATELHLASPFHLHGVGPAYTMKLAICGVETIGGLLECDLENLSEASTIPLGVLGRIRLKARSMVNNEIIRVMSFEPPSRDVLYLDIETTLRRRMVWLIGFMTGKRVVQLYADDFDEEREVLEEFVGILKQYADHVLVTWSSFDTRVLSERLRIHGLIGSSRLIWSMAHMDLRLELRRSFIFPTRGYGLKRIGSFLEYPFRNPDFDGLHVAREYERHLLTGVPLHRRFFEYNEDDVLAMPYILDWAVVEQATNDRIAIDERRRVNRFDNV